MKRLLTAILFSFLFSNIFAQGICDSTIYINPIADICAAPYDIVNLSASHPGGVFSGPFITEYGIITTQNMIPGIYTATYTITTDDCTLTAMQDFTVLDRPEAQAWSIGTIDCTNPASSSVELHAIYDGDGFAYWYGPNGFISYDYFATVNYGGVYTFVVEELDNYTCSRNIAVLVEQQGAEPVNIVDCSNCNSGNYVRVSVVRSKVLIKDSEIKF